MRTLLITTGIVIAIALIDRVLVWCELRGWITYRLTPRPKNTFRRAAGGAMLDLDALLQPGRRHIIEMRQEQEMSREEEDESGPNKPPKQNPPKQSPAAS